MYDGAMNALDANNEPIFDIDKDEITPVNTFYPGVTVCPIPGVVVVLTISVMGI